MSLESSVTQISDLNSAWPTATDPRSDGDNHVRYVKTALKSLLTNLEQIGFEELEVNLTAPTEITWSGDSPIKGRRLTVFVTQDGVGGHTITWDTDFFVLTSTELALGANQRTVFNFVGRADGKWYMCCPQLMEFSS